MSRRLLVSGAVVFLLLAAGYVLRQMTAVDLRRLQPVLDLVLVLGAVIFVVVQAALILAALRDRQPSPDAELPPPADQRREAAWTAAPAVLLVLLLAFTWQVRDRLVRAEAGPALRVEVVGHQWWWEFRYPEQAVVTANELVVPYGAQVELVVTSADVLHGFWAPELFGRVDALPGGVTRTSFRPVQAGVRFYGGQCSEACGARHAAMRFVVEVLSAADFQTWAEDQRMPAGAPGAAARPGLELFQARGCPECHTVRGTSAAGQGGPDLTHLMSREQLAAGLLDNTPANLKLWLTDHHQLKPANAMAEVGPLAEAEADELVNYLLTLK